MKTKFTFLAFLSFFMCATGFSQTTEVTGTLSAGSGYVAGETIEIPFNIDFTNIDEEYVDLLELTFPAGVTIEGVSNEDVFIDNEILFGAGAPNADYNGIVGQTVSWGDDNNVFGGIFTSATIDGELTALSYDFTVTITVDAGTTGDLTVDFFASGDEFGPNPADLSGSVTIGEGVSVYGIVVNSADHTVLELAVNTAGLQGALAGAVDPVTLFAPTDAAFTTFLTDNGLTAEELLANPELANILLYHALGLSAPSSGLTDGQVVETLLTGQTVTIGVVADPFAVTVNGENVSAPDLAGSNGIVHVIDGVLTPASTIELPLDFELPAEDYTIVGFGGAQNTSIIPNPDPSGVNTSANVWQQTQDAANTAETFAGAVIDLSTAVDFSGSGLIAMDIWTPIAADVTLRFEIANNDPASAGMERTLSATTTSGWETLTFDFTGDANIGNDFVRCVVFFNLGANNTDDTFYADNIRNTDLPTVFDIVEGSDVHETLETALIASGLDGVTSDPAADLTLFAPTDDAFDNLPAGLLDELLDDPTGALANVLLYHVVGGTALSGDLSDGQEVLTLQGETVTVAINGEVITINGAEVTLANLPASNGVVHVIDAVLVPTTCTSFVGGPYTNFGAAPAAVDGVCPFNVITGFESWASEGYIATDFVEGTTYTFGLSGGSIGAWDPAFIVIDATTGEVVASETEGNSITWVCPADGDYIWIIQEEGFCGGQSANTDTDNGFPYMTCGSSVTITDIVVASEDHNTLETAVIEAGLDGVLAGEGPFTVFAPTDAAFDLLPDGLLDDLLADPTGDLTTILTHHVANGIAYSTDLSDGQSIPTLQGEDVTVGVGEVVTITSATGVEAEVTVADIVASNGVVHVIDAVLIPTLSSVDNLTSVDEVKVFPNPTNNQFTLDLELNASERVTVDLVNIVGQVVKTVDLGNRSAGLNREYIDVNDLSEGIYFMNLTVGGTQGTVKVQVVR